MSLALLTKNIGRIISDNSPTILTAIGATGVLTTAYLTGKATLRAAEILDDMEERQSKKEVIKATWKLYIPAATTGILTIFCIIEANRIGNRRAAAVAAAYSISERLFEEYKDKVVETIGEKKEQEIRDELAQDRVNKNPLSNTQVFIAEGNVLCYDAFTGRYFRSSMESLRRAQNDINGQILNDFYAPLSDFYARIGLPPTSQSDEIGWNSDKMMELDFSAVLSENNEPCIAIDFRVAPFRNYSRVY